MVVVTRKNEYSFEGENINNIDLQAKMYNVVFMRIKELLFVGKIWVS